MLKRLLSLLLCAVLIVASGLPADSLTPPRRVLLAGSGLPAPPAGLFYLVDTDGADILDTDQAFIVTP